MTSFIAFLKQKLFWRKDMKAERLVSVRKLAPMIFSEPGKLLYVGARHDRMDFGNFRTKCQAFERGLSLGQL